jgi:hypothetical protein
MGTETPRCTDSHETWYLLIFRKSVKNFHFFYNLTRIPGILHEDLRTFMIISRRILLRMRNVSEEMCRENQNAQFMFKNFFPKIVLFFR